MSEFIYKDGELKEKELNVVPNYDFSGIKEDYNTRWENVYLNNNPIAIPDNIEVNFFKEKDTKQQSFNDVFSFLIKYVDNIKDYYECIELHIKISYQEIIDPIVRKNFDSFYNFLLTEDERLVSISSENDFITKYSIFKFSINKKSILYNYVFVFLKNNNPLSSGGVCLNQGLHIEKNPIEKTYRFKDINNQSDGRIHYISIEEVENVLNNLVKTPSNVVDGLKNLGIEIETKPVKPSFNVGDKVEITKDNYKLVSNEKVNLKGFTGLIDGVLYASTGMFDQNKTVISYYVDLNGLKLSFYKSDLKLIEKSKTIEYRKDLYDLDDDIDGCMLPDVFNALKLIQGS